jgi:hypothetical protein
MFLDDEMLKMMLSNMGYSDVYIDEFSYEIKNLFFEMVIAHIFNYYASQNSQTEIDELESLMHKTKKYGKYEDQKQIMDLIMNTVNKYPELTEQIIDLQKEMEKKLLMGFIESADENAQIELFSYLIQMKNFLAEKRKLLDAKN